MKTSALIGLVCTLSVLSACASKPAQTVEEKNDAAIAKCFEKFRNWPTQRLSCIDQVRGTEDPSASRSKPDPGAVSE